MIAIRRRLASHGRADSLTYVISSVANSFGKRVSLGVLERRVVFGVDPSHSVRFGHFDYLKEDSDDEYKYANPDEQLKTKKFLETVTLADKLVFKDKVALAERQNRYRKNNEPAEPPEKKWGSWLTMTDGRKKYKFDTDYSARRLFAKMDFSGGGTITEDSASEFAHDKESVSTLSELGKGSSTGIRALGERLETESISHRRAPLSDRFDPGVGFERLPTLNLGRQYDTGLKFDRTRPTIRKDRYATAWARAEIEPKKRTDGSLDTRPVLEFDLAKTDAVRYLGGERYQTTSATSSDPSHIPAAGADASGSGNGQMAPSDDTELKPVTDFVHNSQPLGVYSRQSRQGPGFRYMTSWQEVYEAYKNIEGPNKAQDISQAFFSLKQMKPPPPNHVLVDMADVAIDHAHEMMPISLTNIVHSCAKMRFMYPPLLSEWQTQLQDPRILEACTDLDVTCLVYSFGVLNRMGNTAQFRDMNPDKGQKGLDFQFIEKLAKEAVHPVRLEKYSCSMLVNILYGLCLLRFNNREILNRILTEITRSDILPRLEIQNISAAIYAIGYLRFWSTDPTTKLLNEAIAHLDEFPSSALGNIMWSLGNLRYPKLDVVGQIAKVVAQEKHLRNYSEQDLTSVLYGLAMTKYRDPEVIGELITEVMRPGRLSQMMDSSLTHLLSSFSCMRYANKHLFQAVLTELASPKRLKHLRNMHMANLFYALGSCRYDDMSSLQPFLDEVVDPDRLQSFSDFDIATIVHGSGGIGIQDIKWVSAVIAEAGKKDRMERYSAQSLANIINACSLLRYRNEELLSSACAELAKAYRVRQMTPTSIALATFALCRLQFYDSKFFSEYLKESTTAEKIKHMRPSTLIDLMFGSVRSDVVHFTQFMEIIKLLRDPRRVSYLLNFPFVRVISVAAIHGLRDEEFLKTIRDEILKEERRMSLTHAEQRDVARSFERLALYDDELCAALNYGRRVRGQSVGILAPGGLRQAENAEKQRELDRNREERNLDWSGQMRPTFYSS